MTLITETVTINSKNYKHIYSDAGYYVKRNDNKLFMDVLEPTSSTYTYTETTQLATQQLLSRMMARMSTLETKHNNLEGLPHVVETYSNGTDWYRVYSDKWCEQAGLAACTVATTTTVNLLLPYKDTQYNIILQPNRVAQDIWGHGDTIPPESKTMNSFGIYIHSSGGSYNLFWRTGGYLT